MKAPMRKRPSRPSRRCVKPLKCKHKLMHLRAMGLGGFHLGFQFMCLDCGASTTFAPSVREARRRWEAGRVNTNAALAAEAGRILKLKVDDIDKQAAAKNATPAKKGKR